MRAAAIGPVLIVVGNGASHVIEVGTVNPPQATGLEDKTKDHETPPTGIRERSALPLSAV